MIEILRDLELLGANLRASAEYRVGDAGHDDDAYMNFINALYLLDNILKKLKQKIKKGGEN